MNFFVWSIYNNSYEFLVSHFIFWFIGGNKRKKETPLEWVFQEKLSISNHPRFQQLLRISEWILTSRCHTGSTLLSRVWLSKLRTVSHSNHPSMLAFSIFHGPCRKQYREGHSKSQRLHLSWASLVGQASLLGLQEGSGSHDAAGTVWLSQRQGSEHQLCMEDFQIIWEMHVKVLFS